MNLKAEILNELFNRLNRLEAEYCVMNNYTNLPEIIPSDVDFAIDIETFGKLDLLVHDLGQKYGVAITQKIWHGYHKCAYTLSPYNIDARFYLQFDFFVDFCASGYPNLFPISELLRGRKKYKNFYIPAVEVEVPFLLQRRIFKSDMKYEHLDRFGVLLTNDPESFVWGVKKIFGNYIQKRFVECVEARDLQGFNNDFSIYRKMLRYISRRNTGFTYRIKYTFSQSVRAIYRLLYPTGMIVAFLGSNVEQNTKLIEKIEAIVSGSFYGARVYTIQDTDRYTIVNSLRDIWSTVTKKIVFLNIVLSPPGRGSNYKFHWLYPRFLLPDIVISVDSEICQCDRIFHKLRTSSSGDTDNVLPDLIQKSTVSAGAANAKASIRPRKYHQQLLLIGFRRAPALYL